MTIEQLLQLVSNPYYIMSTNELKQLEDYNNKQYEKSKNTIVKHSTSFKIHNPNLKEEKVNGEVSKN
jgi:hypothetical protein